MSWGVNSQVWLALNVLSNEFKAIKVCRKTGQDKREYEKSSKIECCKYFVDYFFFELMGKTYTSFVLDLLGPTL